MAGTFGRKELRGHTPVSATTVHGWGSFIFGIPFAGTGLFIILVSMGVVEVDPGSVHAPMWVLGVCGAVFFGAGGIMMVHGLRGVCRNRQLEQDKRKGPNKPWLWDYPWEPLGISETNGRKVLKHFGAVLFLGIFLSIFNWWAFFSGQGQGMLYFVVGLFDLILLIVVGHAFYKLFQFLKYGNSRLRFADFPFYLGAGMKLRLEGLPDVVDMLKLNLRMIEEAYEVRGSGKNRSQTVVSYQRYHESRELKGRQIPGARSLDMVWKLPEDAGLSSRISERPAWYWELEVEADTPGIDYHARFLLPVYAKS